MQIILDDYSFELIHRTNKKIKRISLSIQNQDEIIIKTPLKFKSHLLKQIVFEHKDWILRSIKKVKPKNSFDFSTGGVIPYLGVDYPMVLKENSKIKTVKFSFDGERFLIEYHDQNRKNDDFVLGLQKFYKYQAKKVIDPIFDIWCHRTQLFPNKIGYRVAKKRWGSCSGENNISINYLLLQFEQKAIEYVVLHELCHIKEKNHSKRFWDLVYSYMPNYKEVEKILKNRIF